jgi:ACT domain-containing protein
MREETTQKVLNVMNAMNAGSTLENALKQFHVSDATYYKYSRKYASN